MPDSPRRGFLKVAGVGIAAAGAAVVAGPHVTRSTGATAATPALPTDASGALVAYVTDVTGGELSVMVEGREVVVTDHDLVARLAHAIHSGAHTSA